MNLAQVVRKLLQGLRYLVRVKKIWHSPRTSDVLIFDAEGHEFLMNYLAAWNPEVLHVRGEQISIPVLIASLAGPGGLNRNRYIDRFLRTVRPRLVVTFIDNNPAFYSLAARHPKVKTLFIQNGVRGYFLDVFETLDRASSSRDLRRVDYMLTLGSSPGAEYAKYIEGTVVPMGSLRNNLVPRVSAKKAGTIAFISQYRDSKGFVIDGSFRSRKAFFENADQIVLSFLLKYAKKNGKHLIIVPCSGGHVRLNMRSEQEYYNKLLGQVCAFSAWNWHGSSYDAADSAEVVVTIDSGLGYESAARGNKTAFFSIRSQLLDIPGLTFGWPKSYPEEGPFWINRPDAAAFERILDRLFAIPEEEWRLELLAHGFAEMMVYDPGNCMLRSVLAGALGTPPQERENLCATTSSRTLDT